MAFSYVSPEVWMKTRFELAFQPDPVDHNILPSALVEKRLLFRGWVLLRRNKASTDKAEHGINEWKISLFHERDRFQQDSWLTIVKIFADTLQLASIFTKEPSDYYGIPTQHSLTQSLSDGQKDLIKGQKTVSCWWQKKSFSAWSRRMLRSSLWSSTFIEKHKHPRDVLGGMVTQL